MLTIYHAPNTRSVRVVMLAEELGLPYELKTLAFDPKDLQSEEYLALHPLGQVPTIDDDGFVMNESGAITEYLLAKYGNGRLVPELGTHDYARYLYWLHFAESSFMPPLGAIAQHAFIRPEDQRIPQVLQESQSRALQILFLVDQALSGREFIVGDSLTGADTMLVYNLHLTKLFGMLGDDTPNAARYYEAIAARPSFQKASAA